MVQRVGTVAQGFKEQMIDALVFSLAVYETAPEKILSVLRYKYDLPVGALDLLHLDGVVSQGIPSSSSGQRTIQPVIVGRSTHGHVVVACRGTADFSDLIADLKIIPKWLRSSSGGAAAHMGFVERAESVDIEPFLQLLKKGEKLVFTGHSLGGAVSSLLALRVLEAAENYNICTHLGQLQCITFGSPLFASPSLANCINEKYHARFCHVVSQHDLVPRIVPLMRMAQTFAGSGADEIAQGMQLVRFCFQAVENITRIPLASALRTVERVIPGPVRGAFSHIIRMILPHRPPQQYAFAGNFLFIDPLAQHDDRCVKLAAGEDLNVFQTELAFALGLNMNVVEHHGLSAYQRGLVKGLKSSFLQAFKKKGGSNTPQMPDVQEGSELDTTLSLLKYHSPLVVPKTKSHRQSMEYMRLRPGGGVAAAAMEAASAGYRSAKLDRLRRSMERNFADCVATLSVIEDTGAAQELDELQMNRNGGAACPPTPVTKAAPEVEPSGFPSGTKHHYTPCSRAADLHTPSSAPIWRFPMPRKILCCDSCKLKKAGAQATDQSMVILTPLTPVPSSEEKPKEKKGFRLGWFIRTVLRVTSFVTSINAVSVACCAVRFLLGSPLF